MNVILSIGLLVFFGYLLGEVSEKVGLPKISGYILAGILLNPDLVGLMDAGFIEHTEPILSIALSLITFSIGGSLSLQKLKATGSTVLWLTLMESIFAFLLVFIVIFFVFHYFIPLFDSMATTVAISLVLASLAAPTDPSATLAVMHEYKAKGPVSSTILEIAAFDDIVGIVIYSLVTALAVAFMGKESFDLGNTTLELGQSIGGAILVGAIFGLIFIGINRLFKKQEEGTLIVLTFSLIALSYGLSEYFGFEALLSTIALGAVTTNFNSLSKEVFQLIERYTDELIFVVFFTLSGLHLQLSVIGGSYLLIIIYIIARAIGKFSGIYLGAGLFEADTKVKKFAAGGLIPQGGIVIGLALILSRKAAFEAEASLIMSVVVGAALIHEIIGPIFSKLSLKKAKEIN